MFKTTYLFWDKSHRIFKKSKILWFATFLSCMALNANTKEENNAIFIINAVQQTVSGTVVDDNGAPLPGASIIEEGTTNGAQSDFDGNFTLSVSDPNATLVISYVGYQSLKLPLAGNTSVDVILKEDSQSLDEVVVIGYGSVKKSDLTGSVGQVTAKDFNSGVNTNVQQLFESKIAGAKVTQSSGEPGGGISLTIRGASSISAGSQPLYVVDGVPLANSSPVSGTGSGLIQSSFTNRSPLGTINPNDIESIQVLKDASASAIYGARAANGVVLITTKKGKQGKISVNYNSYVGIQNPSYKYDLLNAQEYKQVVNELIDTGAAPESQRVEDIINGGTDWQEEIFNRNSIVTYHNLSFSGGNEKTTYLTSLSFLAQPGVIKNNDFNRGTARINIDHNFNDILKIGTRMNFSYTDESFIPYGNGFNETAGVINAALNYDPTIPVKNENGDYYVSPFITIDNPLAIANGLGSKSNRYNNLLNFFAEYFIDPDFSVKLNLGFENTNETKTSYANRLTQRGLSISGDAAILNGNRLNYLIEGFANYKKEFNNGVLTVLAGATTQTFSDFNFSSGISGFASDATGPYNLALGDPLTARVGSGKSKSRLNSFFSRVNYSLLDRYLITGTIRADGSSKFGENNKYGMFPSLALGWKLSSEEFLKDNKVISSLKLRGSWGSTGNQNIGNFQSLTTFRNGPRAVFNDELVATSVPSRIANPDLKWEKTEKIDVGVDFELFKGRISGVIDYFNQKTTDLLLDVPIPVETGFGSILQNVGSMRNSGWELSLTTRNISDQDFSWTTDLNLTTLKNKVLDLGSRDEIIGGRSIIREGEPLNSFYGYEVLGTWQENDDYSTTTDNVQPGDYKFRDADGNGTITAEDRVILGNSFPELTYGITNTFRYKRFGLSFVFNGELGVQKFNENILETFNPVNFRRNKLAKPYLNRWTPDNPTNRYPSFVRPKALGDRSDTSSYTVLDADYLKLSNFQVSYNLIESGYFVKSATVYISGQNLFVISDFLGDPSISTGSNSSFAVVDNPYPLSRTFLLGVNLNF